MVSRHFQAVIYMLLGIAGTIIIPPGTATAADQITHSTLRLKVGQTGQIGVFGGHKFDCTASIPPEIRIVKPPALGTVSQRENTPYTAKTSISGTCIGAQFMGTAVDYTATSPGSDTMVFEAVFSNGLQRRTVSITNR